MINNKLTQIKFALSGMNMLNAAKNRGNALEVFHDWFPKASDFMAQIKKIQSNLLETKAENKKLTDKINNVHEEAKRQAEIQYIPEIQKLKRLYNMKDEEYDKYDK